MPNWVTGIQSCDMASLCNNSSENTGAAMCGTCRLAPGNEEFEKSHWWPRGDVKHPVLEQEKRNRHKAKLVAAADKRKNRDRKRMTVGRIAARAEKRSEAKANVMVATKNSGRSHRDGDHTSHGFITLDTKLQSNNINPVVHLFELEKVRRDARNGGNSFGGLILRNKYNVGVVVMTEDDFHKLTSKVQA